MVPPAASYAALQPTISSAGSVVHAHTAASWSSCEPWCPRAVLVRFSVCNVRAMLHYPRWYLWSPATVVTHKRGEIQHPCGNLSCCIRNYLPLSPTVPHRHTATLPHCHTLYYLRGHLRQRQRQCAQPDHHPDWKPRPCSAAQQ